MRTHIKPPYTKEEIDEDDKEDVIEVAYNLCTTLPLGTTHNYREPHFKDTW